ncbi:unnamed protein product [Trichobilharzia szidati]|nr:unnamed protein product [Trichobilharzia szidati]
MSSHENFIGFIKSSLKYVAIALILGLIVWSLLNKASNSRRRKAQLSKKKAQTSARIERIRRRLASLPKPVNNFLSYVDKDLSEVCEEMQKGNITPVDLLHAYQTKALELFDKGNSGIADFIEEAEEQATVLENTKNEEVKSPLYGVPVSIKETCSVSGYDCTMGTAKLCNVACQSDSVIVKALKNVGAVPFVTTATSQVCSSLDGFNPVCGEVSHPFNKSRIPGGSSSGEAVLLALHGSPIGIGTDLGGSIRIPASFCGLVSLKPTTVRISNLDIVSSCDTSVIYLKPSIGPMGRKVEDLVRFMRALLSPAMFDLDPYVMPTPFDDVLYSGSQKRSLVIGFYDNFNDPNIIPVLKVSQIAVNKAAIALKKAGHQIVQFTVPNPYRAYILGLRAMFADGGLIVRKQLHGESVGPQLRSLDLLLRFPNFLRPLADIPSRYLVGKPPSVAHTTKKLRTGEEALNIVAELNAYRNEFSKAWSDAGPLDALICPITPYPAPPKDASSSFINPSVVYAIIYNVLDYPAGTVPVGSVHKSDVEESLNIAQSLYLEGEKYASQVFKLLKDGEGLPLSVQVVSKPYHEETVLRVMHDIEEYINQVGQ